MPGGETVDDVGRSVVQAAVQVLEKVVLGGRGGVRRDDLLDRVSHIDLGLSHGLCRQQGIAIAGTSDASSSCSSLPIWAPARVSIP